MLNYCKIAYDMSLQSDHPLYQHGAVLVRGKEIVAAGYNSERYHAEAKVIYQCVQ